MKAEEILRHVDHTLLKNDAGWEQVRQLCVQGLEYNVASVCILPVFVKRAAELLDGRLPVCTVVGFPLGACVAKVKAFEAKNAVMDGAGEIDMVVCVNAVKDADWDAVRADIMAVREACRGKVLKVIAEACLLERDEKARVCGIARECGADFIKTSTGFSTGGATREDVRLFVENAGDKMKVKASGGIRTRQDMEDYLKIGAQRLGTSGAVKILAPEIGRQPEHGF